MLPLQGRLQGPMAPLLRKSVLHGGLGLGKMCQGQKLSLLIANQVNWFPTKTRILTFDNPQIKGFSRSKIKVDFRPTKGCQMENSNSKDWDSLGSRSFHNVAVFTQVLRPDVYKSLGWPCRRGFRLKRRGSPAPQGD